jgi:hypothetical protein
MAIIQSGANTQVTMTVDPTLNAARVNLRPNEVVGSFRGSLSTATQTAGTVSSGGVLYSFKYTGTGLCIIRSVQMGYLVVTTGFTQGGSRFGLYVGRSSYTAPTGNATTVTWSANKKRTSQATPNATSYIQIAGGTMTGDVVGAEDTYPFSSLIFNFPTGVTTMPLDGIRDFIQPVNPSSYPLILAANECFRIKSDTGLPATGTAQLTVNVEWEEVPLTGF